MSDGKLKTGRFFCLDVARGLAIIGIILYHVRHIYPPLMSADGTTTGYWAILRTVISKGGELGVELFFLISGYSIYSSIINQRGSLSGLRFLMKRLRRIYVPYWYSLICAGIIIPIIIATINYIKYKSFDIKWIPYSFVDWIEVITLIRVFFSNGWPPASAFAPLWVNWYIAIILQIYIIISLIITLRLSLLKTCIVLTIVSLVSMIHPIKNIIPIGLFVPYWIDFSTGILLFYMIHGLGHSWHISHKGGVIVAFVLISMFVYLYIITSQPIFACIIAASIAYCLYPYDDAIASFIPAKVMAFVGRISYSLYLMNNPLLWIIAPNLYIFRLPAYITYPYMPLFLVIISGYIWYVLFEKPSTLSANVLAIVHPLDAIRSDMLSAKNPGIRH